MSFAIYDLSSGAIRFIYEGPNYLLEANTPNGCSAIPIDNGDDLTARINIAASPHRVIDKNPINYARSKATITANGIDTVLISNLPSGFTVSIESEEFSPTGTTFEFGVDVPGSYEITFSHPLYLVTSLLVIAT